MFAAGDLMPNYLFGPRTPKDKAYFGFRAIVDGFTVKPDGVVPPGQKFIIVNGPGKFAFNCDTCIVWRGQDRMATCFMASGAELNLYGLKLDTDDLELLELLRRLKAGARIDDDGMHPA